MDFFSWLFDTSQFMRRSDCGDWPAWLMWTHVASDALIFFAYMSIPASLAYLAIVKKRDLPFTPLFWFFAAFIFFCGTTHAVEAGMFWSPQYRLNGLLKACTAVISWITVIALVRVMPKALGLPGMIKMNERLHTEIEERRIVAEQLDLARKELETRVKERTTALEAEVAHHKSTLSELRTTEEKLRGIHRELEGYIVQRTSDLVKANEKVAKLAAIVESSQDAIISQTLDGRVISWNPGAEHMYGYTAAEVVGGPIDVIVPPDTRGSSDGMNAARRGEDVLHTESRRRSKAGAVLDVSLTISPIRDANGKVYALSTIERDITEQRKAERTAQEEAEANDAMNRIGKSIAGELDLEKLLQAITDECTKVTGAAFGAFFYNAKNEQGDIYQLYTLSGVAGEAFSKFPMPRKTAIFAPTFDGDGIVRSDDITKDPRYGHSEPHHGMPAGHLPVRSYLAAPVISRTGKVLGGLFFGHSETGIFTNRDEKTLAGVAIQAAVAIDNAVLYKEARTAERRLAEQLQLNKAVTTSIREAIIAVDREGCVTFMNPAARDMVGYGQEEFAKENVIAKLAIRNTAGSEVTLSDVTAAPVSGDASIATRSGKALPVAFTASPLLENGKPSGSVITFHDITARRTAEEMLKENERRFRGTFENAAVGIAHVDSSAHWVHANPKMCSILGYTSDEITQLAFPEATHPDDIVDEMKLFDAVMRGEMESYTLEKRYFHKSGAVVWANTTKSLQRDIDGKPQHCIAIVEDISERKRLEVEVRQRAEELAQLSRTQNETLGFLDSLLANAPVGFAFFDREHRFVRVNDFLADSLSGAPVEDHLGRTLREVMGDRAPSVETMIDSVFESRESLREIEVSGETPKAPGVIRSWLISIYPVVTADSAIPWVGMIAAEVTMLKQAERELRENEENLRLAFAAGRLGAWEWDIKTDKLKHSERTYEILGQTPGKDLTIDDLRHIVHPEERARVRGHLTESIRNRTDFELEYQVLWPDGSSHWVASRGRALYDEKGAPLRLVGVSQDITERRNAEETLRVASQRVITTLESISDAFVSIDNDWRYTYVNDTALKVLRRERAELIGKRMWDLFPEAAGTESERNLRLARDENRTVQFESTDAATGESYDVRVYPTPDGLSVFFTATTQRRQAERALRINRERLDLVIRAAELGVWFCDLPFNALQWNEKCKEHFGVPTDAPVTIDMFFERLHPEDRETTRTAMEHSIAANSPYDVTYRTVSPQGHMRFIRATGAPFYDEQGVARRFDGVTIDISDRKRAEEELIEANKELESFAFIASHDLKAPLRAVSGYIQLLDRRLGPALGAEERKFITGAVESAEQMTLLINDLLAFSRVHRADRDFREVPLERVLARALANLRADIQESGAEITTGDLPTVYADETMLMQVFQNLIGNAIKFHGEEPPKVHVEAQRRDVDWLISVKDNGIGIDPKYRERIFDIFKRLHSSNHYPGTGIGLAICKKIADRHQGKIWVESEKGHGAVFFMTLPIKGDSIS